MTELEILREFFKEFGDIECGEPNLRTFEVRASWAYQIAKDKLKVQDNTQGDNMNTGIPITDEEAIAIITDTGRDGHEVYAQAVIGIYQIRRALGQSVLDAYEEALWAGARLSSKLTVEQVAIQAAEKLIK